MMRGGRMSSTISPWRLEDVLAVDLKDLARDVGRVGGGQEADQRRDFLGPASGAAARGPVRPTRRCRKGLPSCRIR